MPSPHAARFHTLSAFLQVASLVVVVVGGVAVASKRAGAQSAPDARPAVTAGARPLATTASDASSEAASAADAVDASAASGAAPRAPIEYAVLQTEQDIDPGLSVEARRALGTGPVPIHREGRFRSALAHPRFGPAAVARVGLVLNSVRNYDIRTGTFEADFFLSLNSDRAMPDVALTLTNGNVSAMTVLVDMPTLKVYRYIATLNSHVDLRRYPYDMQQLTIQVEDRRAGVDQLVFTADPDRTSLDEGFAVAGWGVSSIGARAYRHAYPPRFDRDDLYVSRYKFVLTVDRFSTSAAFSVFVPALIIILISLTGLWMPFAQVEVRSNTGAPMLAAAVLFHFSLMQSLPATGYLTRADKVMLALYVALLLNMLSTWAFFVVAPERHEALFRTSRALVPVASLAVMCVGSFA